MVTDARAVAAGDFSFPVKYGYSATGIVTAGPDRLIGQRVFALHPHQDHFQVAEKLLLRIPPRRAIAAGGAGSQHGNGAQRPLGRRHGTWRPRSRRRSRHHRALGRLPRPPHCRDRCDYHRHRSGPRALRRSTRREIRRSARYSVRTPHRLPCERDGAGLETAINACCLRRPRHRTELVRNDVPSR